jgi:tRNA nucleotidyltransferase/poly(A) polymerase
MLKLGDEIIMEGIFVSRPSDARFASSFSLESSDPVKIKTWCKELGILLKIPKERIQIELKAEAGDGDAEEGS